MGVVVLTCKKKKRRCSGCGGNSDVAANQLNRLQVGVAKGGTVHAHEYQVEILGHGGSDVIDRSKGVNE